MYRNVTHITWNYEDTQNVKGQVHGVDSHSLTSFDISKKDGMSGYEIANQIWGMIEESSEAAGVNKEN